MLVPETAVHLDDLVQAREYEIGSSGQCLHVEPVSKPHAMHEATHNHFDRRIPAADAPHILASVLRRHSVQNQTPEDLILAWMAFAYESPGGRFPGDRKAYASCSTVVVC